MKNKKIYLLLAGLLVLSFSFNSCKKEKLTSIPTLFTTGEWQLGSIVRTTYLGDQQLSQDTIPSDSTQIFKFNNDMTCTYTNFDDKVGTATGKWSLSDTQLNLSADITYTENTSADTKQPFINANIINLGDYSLVIETGDIQPYYTSTDTRVIRRYGFIRIRPVVTK